MPGTEPASSPGTACAHRWLLTSPEHGPYATYGCQHCPAAGKGYEVIPRYGLSNDEILAEARRAALAAEQGTDENRAARDLLSAFRALDSALSADGALPAGWTPAGDAFALTRDERGLLAEVLEAALADPGFTGTTSGGGMSAAQAGAFRAEMCAVQAKLRRTLPSPGNETEARP
jgi:hypothetical protein